jgi:hypothetical protein
MPAYEGALKATDHPFTNVRRIGEKKLHGPETIVFTPEGVMYTGLLNGQIARIGLDGSIEKIVQMGEETNETLCSELSLKHRSLLFSCSASPHSTAYSA